jgi:hypothetical protein
MPICIGVSARACFPRAVRDCPRSGGSGPLPNGSSLERELELDVRLFQDPLLREMHAPMLIVCDVPYTFVNVSLAQL